MTDQIKDLIDFISFTHEIRNVKRAMWVKNEEQYENDSEHGYQLAMTALFVIEEKQLSIDNYTCMALALVHDVIEVYAGDTPVFGPQHLIDSQSQRETKARMQLKQKWPKFTLLHDLIDEYEAKQSNEAKFIYALDKLVPIINNYLDDGRNWKKDTISLEDHVATKAPKVALDNVIESYYNDIMEVLALRPDLFP